MRRIIRLADGATAVTFLTKGSSPSLFGVFETAISPAVSEPANMPSAPSSEACGQTARMKPSERARGHHTHEQDPHTSGDCIVGSAEVECSHTSDKKVGDDEVRKTTNHVHDRRGDPSLFPHAPPRGQRRPKSGLIVRPSWSGQVDGKAFQTGKRTVHQSSLKRRA